MTESPNTRSSDFDAMMPYWDMVETILNGAEAMRKAGTKYLPKFPKEIDGDYKYRQDNAKFTNIYRDIVESLAAKPFSKELRLLDNTTSASIVDLSVDIDGRGNSLHVFAANMFFNGINNAIDWIFVDKPPVREGASQAEEKAMGARPYWVHIHAKNMLAVYSAVVNGKEEIVHARILEKSKKRDGFEEKEVERVRVLNREPLPGGAYGPATYELWEEQKNENTQKKEWVSVGSGDIAIGVIAIVPFITGRRKEGSWQFVPPMQDAAFLQIEHYQQETNLKSAKEQACFPMLVGNGTLAPVDEEGKPAEIVVGPKTVLISPPNSEGTAGSWGFIEPSATSLKFLAGEVQVTEQQLRELGRQPLTAQTGNLTVITTAFAASKANTVIQAWAINAKDAIEQALVYTALWLGETIKPSVDIYTDFSVDMESDKAPEFILKLHDAGMISREAVIAEAKRRNLLSAEYDAEADLEKILSDIPGDDVAELAAALTPKSPNQDGKGATA